MRKKKKFGRAGLDLKAKRNAMLGFFFFALFRYKFMKKNFNPVSFMIWITSSMS
jgi:hypothetical protein